MTKRQRQKSLRLNKGKSPFKAEDPEVEEIFKRVKEGKARTFKNASELNAFLESLKTEE